MAVTEQKKIEALNEDIKGLQRAIRRQSEESVQTLELLRIMRNELDLQKNRIESLELKLPAKTKGNY